MKTMVQHPVRLYTDTWEKLKVKNKVHGLSFQKMTEIFFKAYLKGNKELDKLIKAHVEKYGKRQTNLTLSELEADEILRLIEQKHSPLKFIENVDEELSNEE